MSILTKEGFFTRVHDYIGEDSSDEGISFLEDLTDTFSELEKRAGDTTDWEKKYKELDESWRKRYTHRFITGKSLIDEPKVDDTTEIDPEEIEIDDLFEVEEE